MSNISHIKQDGEGKKGMMKYVNDIVINKVTHYKNGEEINKEYVTS